MNGVRRFFDYFDLHNSFLDDFELSYFQVGHPNSAKNDQFYPTAKSLGILASPVHIPLTTFDSALSQNNYVIAGDSNVVLAILFNLIMLQNMNIILYTVEGNY